MRFNSKELAWIIIALIIFEFIVVFPLSTYNPLILLTPVLILAVNLIAKKLAAPVYNLKITYTIWKFQRYGWYSRSRFKKPFPIGLLFPFLLSLLSLGKIKVFTLLQFNEENISRKRLLKKRGAERRSQINDSDIASTASWGFYSLLILAIIANLPVINIIFPQLAKYSIFYGFWNLFPFGNLDGSKLFFGSRVSWFIITFLCIIGLILILIF